MQALGLHISELDGGRRVHREVQGRLITILKHNGQVYAFDSRCFHQGGDLGGAGDIEDFHGHCVVRCPVHGRRIDLADGRCLDTNLDGEVFVVATSQGDAAALPSQGDPDGPPPHRVHPVFVDTDGTLRVLVQDGGPPRPCDRYNATGGGRGGGPGGSTWPVPPRPPGAAGVGLGAFPVSPRRAVGLATATARGAPRPMAYEDDGRDTSSSSPPPALSSGGSGGGASGSEGFAARASTSGEGAGAAGQGPLTPFAGWAPTAPGGGTVGGGLPAVFRAKRAASGGLGGAAPAAAPPKAPVQAAAGAGPAVGLGAPALPPGPPSPGGPAAFAARGAAARRAVLERAAARPPPLAAGVVRAPLAGTPGQQLTLDAFFGARGGRGGGGGVVAMDE